MRLVPRLAVLLALISPSFAAEAPPRYKFQKGQHLIYASEGHFKYDSASMDDTSTSEIWVTDSQPDGSAKLLVLTTSGYGHGETERRFFSAKLSPTGEAHIDGPPNPHANLSSLFPSLPPTDAAAGNGWQSDPDLFGGTVRYSSLPDPTPAGSFLFKGISDSPDNKIYLSSRSTTFHFDTSRGLLDHAETQITQDYGFHGKGTNVVRLKSQDQTDPAALSQLSSDADVYFAAAETYRVAMESAEKDPALASQFSDADQPLKEAQTKVTNPTIKELLESQIARHQRDLTYFKESAERRAAVLNKPAPDFSTTDYDGKPIKLSDLRGKVVLLDFWYRGCGWCIRAMPQLKQLADDFRGQPVVLFGMNNDAQPEDARFVIKEMSLNYPTLKAEGLPEKFNVRGFPTLLLIDQQGIVRDIHVGWTPTLRKDIGDEIRKLLLEKKPPAD